MALVSVSSMVGGQVRLRREQRGMSAAELSRRAGLSKATLSGIEAGRANPTIETLDAIAGALAIPLTDLLVSERQAEATLVPATAPTGDIDRELLRRVSGGNQLEVWRLRLPAGNSFDGVPHATGTVEHLFVAHGALVAGPSDDLRELSAGDLLAFPGDRPHRYLTESGADVCVVLASPTN